MGRPTLRPVSRGLSLAGRIERRGYRDHRAASANLTRVVRAEMQRRGGYLASRLVPRAQHVPGVTRLSRAAHATEGVTPHTRAKQAPAAGPAAPPAAGGSYRQGGGGRELQACRRAETGVRRAAASESAVQAAPVQGSASQSQ